VKHALAGGNWVIAPEHALVVGGPQRFAWWQVDPRSGATIAVTDDGLHGAAPVERPFTAVIITTTTVAGEMAIYVSSSEGGVGAFEEAVTVLAERVVEYIATLPGLLKFY
jgi:hypothetical protein